jgi:hypothetical protein
VDGASAQLRVTRPDPPQPDTPTKSWKGDDASAHSPPTGSRNLAQITRGSGGDENWLIQALARAEPLAEKHPKIPTIRSELALVHLDFGDLRRRQGRLWDARDHYETCVANQEAVCGYLKDSRAPKLLASYSAVLAGVLLDLGEHAEAVKVAEGFIRIQPGAAEEMVRAAGLIAAACAGAARNSRLPDDQRAAQARAYEQRAIGLLSEAIQNGYRDRNRLQSESSLSSLRALSGYGAALRALRKLETSKSNSPDKSKEKPSNSG